MIKQMQAGNYGKGSFISLYENKLTRFEAEVFKPVLEQMAPYDSSYVFILNSKYENKIINV